MAGSRGHCVLNYLSNCRTVARGVCPVRMPTSSAEGSRATSPSLGVTLHFRRAGRGSPLIPCYVDVCTS